MLRPREGESKHLFPLRLHDRFRVEDATVRQWDVTESNREPIGNWVTTSRTLHEPYARPRNEKSRLGFLRAALVWDFSRYEPP